MVVLGPGSVVVGSMLLHAAGALYPQFLCYDF